MKRISDRIKEWRQPRVGSLVSFNRGQQTLRGTITRDLGRIGIRDHQFFEVAVPSPLDGKPMLFDVDEDDFVSTALTTQSKEPANGDR